MKLHKATFVTALLQASRARGHDVGDPQKCAETKSWVEVMYASIKRACIHINQNRDRHGRPCPTWMLEILKPPDEMGPLERDLFEAHMLDVPGECKIHDEEENGESENQEDDEEESGNDEANDEKEDEAEDEEEDEVEDKVVDTVKGEPAVLKKPAAAAKRPGARPQASGPSSGSAEPPKEEYAYGFDEEKSLMTRRGRSTPKSVPDELAVSMKEPANAKTTDAMIGVFKDGSEAECAQYTVAMHRGQVMPAAKKMPKVGRKVAPKFFKKDWAGGTLEVSLKDNTYKGKPPQRLVILRGPSGQIMQVDCKFWLTDKSTTWEHSDKEKRSHAETNAAKWMTEIAEQLHDGKLTIMGVMERKADFILRHRPASFVKAKKMPKKKKKAEPVADTADNADTADTADTADAPKGLENEPVAKADDKEEEFDPDVFIIPLAKRMPKQNPAVEEGLSTPPAVGKRASSPTREAPIDKKPRIAPPSSDTDLD